jgi:hypothetical protein
MTILTKENGIKVAKGLAFIVTPAIIILLVLAFLYWKKQKNKKSLREAIEASNKPVANPDPDEKKIVVESN